MTDSDVILLEKDGPVATVTLNRPQVFNAFNSQLRSGMRRMVEDLNADDQVRIIVLKGAGPGFSGGADLGEGLTGSVTEELESEYRPFLAGIADSPKIWIASVHGSAAGIGGALAMVCDLLVMAEDAHLYLAFAAIGLVPDGGATWQLYNAMGYRRALETVIEGRRIPADECRSQGLANRIAPAAKVHEVARQWAENLARGAPLAQAAAKRLLRQAGQLDYGEAFSREAVAQQPLTESEDCRNAIAAFFEKRKPEFRGR